MSYFALVHSSEFRALLAKMSKSRPGSQPAIMEMLKKKTKSVNVQIYWVGSTEMAFSVQKRIIGVDARYIGSHTASQSGYLSICLNKWPLKSAKQNKRKQG